MFYSLPEKKWAYFPFLTNCYLTLFSIFFLQEYMKQALKLRAKKKGTFSLMITWIRERREKSSEQKKNQNF